VIESLGSPAMPVHSGDISVDVAAKATIFPCCVPTLQTWVCRDWPRALPLGTSTLEVMDRPHPLFDH
jgi:hypothetical protein